MKSPASRDHVYDREIRDDERTSLSVLTAWIRPGSRVLDLGCGSGAVGRFLAQRDGSALIDGLTHNPEEAAAAQPAYRRVEIADLDSVDILALFPQNAYDAVICADVLEHVRDSERVLAACHALLAEGGTLLISVPNISYAGFLAELLAGEFRYRAEGLLDDTHVRFFTRSSLSRYLQRAGWEVTQFENVRRELPASEFRAPIDALPPAVSRYLLALPDALTYQFVLAARPNARAAVQSGADAQTDVARAEPAARALFTSQLYFSRGDGYQEQDKRVAAGVIGEERQVLRFALPDAPIRRLRFDPADRPGYLHLHALRLSDARGAVLWEWHSGLADALLAAPHHELIAQPPSTQSGGFLLLLHGDDPWIELPIAPELVAQSAGGELAATLGWPMSADYLALAGTAQRLQHGRDAEAQALGELRAAREDLSARLSAAQSEAKVQDATIRQLNERNLALLTGTSVLSRERDEAMRILRSIEQSTVFRVTRPVVHAKMRVDRLLGRARPGAAEARSHAPVPQTPSSAPIDVIVPVYRGLADTQRCVLSVLNAANRTDWRLVLINDASPEPAVTAWLREIAAAPEAASRIVLLENELNLGFVGTVNRGMSLAADRDVVLLNSDAEVNGDWLDRLHAAAYSDRKIASVTPFSNNATICSYPRFAADNDLPAGWSLPQLDALCARTLPGQVVDVPTGVGFCMYIRRAALAAVGLFDVANFGKGYGEENDFCVRAAADGWRNLHALDTFVFHAGGVSFGAAKSPSERAAMETMRRLHPRYEGEVLAFVLADPAAPARALLDFGRVVERRLPVILAVTHDREGGTLQNVMEVAELLAGQASCLMLRPASDGAVTLELAERATSGSRLRFALPAQFDHLIETLRLLGVRHVHFHHLLGHSALVRETLVQRLGVTHDFTAHDFQVVCPQLSMIGPSGAYCGELGLRQCHDCLRKNPAPNHADIVTWRKQHELLLTSARHIIAPTVDTARRLYHYVPSAPYITVAHPEPTKPSAWPAPKPIERVPGQPLKVVVIGALSPIKGADVLEDVAVAARQSGAAIEFHLVGHAYRSLRTQPRAALTVHGPYRGSQELQAMLDWLKPDVAWFPVRVPETYSYTLSEALLAALPIVASDLGAFPERLQGRAWTWIEPWDLSPPEWLAVFARLGAGDFSPSTPAARQPASQSDVSADPPVPEMPRADAAWYGSEYLRGLPAAQDGPNLAALRAVIGTHLAARLPSSSRSRRRMAALRALSRLRAMPMLTPVARSIPPRWQARMKDWLMR